MKSANSVIPPGTGQSWDSSRRLLHAAEHSHIPPVVAGFDGFVDTILHVVSERRSPTEYTRLLTLREFAQRVLAASGGRNINIEMVTRLTKMHAVGNDADSAVGVEASFTDHPRISTGAGDHFNAGFCLGCLLGGDLEANIRLGVATSGYYVREAKSPTLAELVGFVETLSQKRS